MLRLVVLGLPLVALTGCGAIRATLEAQERYEEFEALEARIDGVQETPGSVIDGRTGTVEYRGLAGFSVPLGGNELLLSGRSVVTADFDSNTINGRFDDWIGYNDGDLLAGQASGLVELTNGTISTDGNGPAIEGDLSGGVTYDGDRYDIDGRAEGDFAGNDMFGLAGSAINDETVITRNGTQVQGAEFGFTGEDPNVN